MQAMARQISFAAQNSKHRVDTLLVKEVADAHSKRISDLMQTADRNIAPAINPVVHRLPRGTDTAGQISITHVFFNITLRRFNCDSYCFLFSILLII